MKRPFSYMGAHLSASLLLSSVLIACGDSSSVIPPTAISEESATSATDAVSTLATDLPLSIGGFSLIDADSNQPIPQYDPLLPGTTLYLDQLPPKLNLIAHAGEGTESVQFDLNGEVAYRVENVPPYALLGDDSGNYKPWTPEPGLTEITATAFSQDRATGDSGDSLSLTLNIEETPAPTPTPTPQPTAEITLALIDAATNQVVPGYSNLQPGEILTLEALPPQLSLRADPQVSNVGSVRFYSGSDSLLQTENSPPYALAGDIDGNYKPSSLLDTPGTKQLIVRAFSGNNGGGQQLATLDFTFELRSDGSATPPPTPNPTPTPVDTSFRPSIDLISLHYDHAPDRDDGHSAAADRTILETEFSCSFINSSTTAVGGAYGENASTYRPDSEAVMDTVFNPCGGYINAHQNWNGAVQTLVNRWTQVLNAGGNIWVKEGGQSDITADVVRQLKITLPSIDTRTRIKVVQHSRWNEDKTTDADLAYVRQETDYIKIRDANAYLNQKGGNDPFEQAALSHPVFGPSWQSAFNYYNPDHRLDFSDTGELMYILGLGEIGIDQFRALYLD